MPYLLTNKPQRTQFGFLIFLIACSTLFFGVVGALINTVNARAELDFRYSFYITQTISSFGVFFFPAILFSYFHSKNWFSYSQANKKVSLHLVGYLFIISLLLLPVIACLGYLNEQISLPNSLNSIELWMRKMENANKELLLKLVDNSTLSILFLNVVAMAIFPALFEEFLFRGTLQPFFTKWFANKHIAVLVTAFIFSAIHFQFFGFIPRFLLGVYLGYLLLWGQSLWLPIIAHFFHNAMSLIVNYITQHYA